MEEELTQEIDTTADNKQTNEDYFGGCPQCGTNDGYLNVGKHSLFVCHQHKVFWWGGYGIFSSWLFESDDVFRENAALLSTYTEIEPNAGLRSQREED